MTAKEEAVKLVARFIESTSLYEDYAYAKRCALIAISDNIKIANSFAEYWDIQNGEWYKDVVGDLIKVKEEIENLD